MEALSSTFLATNYPQLHNISSFEIVEVPRPKYFTASSSFTSSNPIKRKQTSQTLETLNNPHEVVVVEKTKRKSLLAIIFNQIDYFICTFIDSPLSPTIDPKRILSGNNAPVDEVPPTACEVVEGSLPSCLDGAYIRNGPNPQFTPRGPYHYFDGDGMLHAVRISQGKATYCSRYIKTHKYIMELRAGYPFVPSFLASFNGIAASVARLVLIVARVVTGQLDPLNHGFGAANTSLALFGGHLYALCESDLPYAVKLTPDGDIITLGRHDFQSSEPFLRMTAHPKIDQETGEVFAYGYDLTRPFLKFFRISSDGRKQKDVPILSMERCAAMHDFAVTKNYAIFADLQIVVNLSWILRGRSPVGVDSGKVPRLGVIPRYAKDESQMWWIDAPGFNMLHCVNCWEEDGGDSIVIVATNIVSVEQILEKIELSQLTLEKITINVKTKTVKRHPVSDKILDLAEINPVYAAKKNRYVYAAVVGSKTVAGVAKVDLSLAKEDGGDCTVASRLYGPEWWGSGPFYVAREPNNPAAAEDDGYLVTYIYDENTNESKFLVMDAKSPTLDIVAAVKLPRRIPHGFHGLFVSEGDLKKL